MVGREKSRVRTSGREELPSPRDTESSIPIAGKDLMVVLRQKKRHEIYIFQAAKEWIDNRFK
jgi:hypothetical protein